MQREEIELALDRIDTELLIEGGDISTESGALLEQMLAEEAGLLREILGERYDTPVAQYVSGFLLEPKSESIGP